jgi:very-short-patch-repair endonuclease|tara:strand:- start:4528 stop:4935 length:408 start_codon:yes stop_codon:yes gene_type:complete
MKFIDGYGKTRNLKNAKKYLIDWGKPSRSKFQTSVKEFLRPYWKSDIVFEEFRVVGSRLTLDFYNANKKIAVEVQGAQHTRYVKFFHKNRFKYSEQLKRDEKKLQFCKANDIQLAEIYPKDKITASLFGDQEIYL